MKKIKYRITRVKTNDKSFQYIPEYYHNWIVGYQALGYHGDEKITKPDFCLSEHEAMTKISDHHIKNFVITYKY